ncbi:glycosyltransferase [Paenibacillus aurantiacus]|uniref:Glycosyltransferase n=1 Tax=Paenibacillus aurantiacus TaxID=1936118 RepID=A0ABV5KXB8_9BACL
MDKLSLTLTMIVKNESQHLDRCLKSVVHLVDELVIVDTGSTDNTKEIALGYGAKVFDYVWSHNFSDARNFALQQSTGDWNLVLDADEYVVEASREEVERVIQSQPCVGRIRRIDAFKQGGEIKESHVWITRLLPKGTFYEGKIHEQPVSELARVNTHFKIYHDGYLNQNKSERNIQLLREAVAENPADPYLLFQLAKEYRMINKHDRAEIYFERFYAQKPGDANYLPMAIVDFLYNIIANKNFERGLSIIEEQSGYLAAYPDFFFVQGLLYTEMVFSDTNKYIQYFARIEQAYQDCLRIGDTEVSDSVRGTGSFYAAYNLGVFYEMSGKVSEAKRCYELSLQDGYKLAAQRLAKL